MLTIFVLPPPHPHCADLVASHRTGSQWILFCSLHFGLGQASGDKDKSNYGLR
jgi:hypothetical protein